MATNDQILKAIASINEKLASAKVLNGGFDKLAVDVKNANSSIQSLHESVDELKDTINDPEKGIISRVRDLEAESNRRLQFVERAEQKIELLEDFIGWQKEAAKKIDVIDQHNIDLDRLKIWQSNVSRLQWLFGSTLFALVVNMLWKMMLS